MYTVGTFGLTSISYALPRHNTALLSLTNSFSTIKICNNLCSNIFIYATKPHRISSISSDFIPLLTKRYGGFNTIEAKVSNSSLVISLLSHVQYWCYQLKAILRLPLDLRSIMDMGHSTHSDSQSYQFSTLHSFL